MHARRTVLLGIAGTAATSLLPFEAFGAPRAAKTSRRGILVGGLKGVDPDSGAPIHALSLVDLDAPDVRRWIKLDFFVHGFALDPRNQNRALLFEKRGPGAAEVDLANTRFVRPLKTREDRAFYGHGTFSRDGALLFVAENHLPTRKGLVSVWDGRTLEPLGEFPTGGENPHECLLTDDGRTLVITNGGGNYPSGDPPCVTFIDVKSRKLLEKYTFTDPRINAGHVQVSKSGAIVVVSAPRDGLPALGNGAVSLASRGGKLLTMTEPEEVTGAMVGEALSIALHEPSQRAAVTCPEGNLVSFWDLKKRAFLAAAAKPKARGVMLTLDGAHFVVCHGQTATLSFFSTKTLEEVPELQIEKSLVAGSHIYAWDGKLA